MAFRVQLNARDFERRLGQFAADASPRVPAMREAFHRAGIAYTAYLRRRYLRNAKGGGGWPPLAPSTLRGKRPDPGILIRSGRLLRSLNLASPDHVRRVTASGLRIGSSVPYLRFHETGAGRLPVRRVIVPPDAPTRAKMDAELDRGVQKMVDLLFPAAR
jgi:hypothetical protein